MQTRYFNTLQKAWRIIYLKWIFETKSGNNNFLQVSQDPSPPLPSPPLPLPPLSLISFFNYTTSFDEIFWEPCPFLLNL